MNVAQLRAILRDWPPSTPVAVRVVEAGEVQLTVDLTSADQYDDGCGFPSLLLIGNLNEAAS